ncbi:MAG TPA: ATP-dependent Clp protease ATP-binding subunit, partial [candidate division WWE3 bacterium]|nr:ATP-dependent Clp protease ATP-binding subunit [candidate division WWE3 bacterium]
LNKGNIEQAISSFFGEVLKLNRVIIYLKNFESLFFATGTGIAVPLIYNSFKSQLEDSGIRYLATCSDEMYSRLDSDNPQSVEGFTVINVDEPSEEVTRKILETNSQYLKMFQRVHFTPSVLDYVYKRAKEEMPEGKFPQKGIDLMDQAGAKVLLKKATVPAEYKDLLEKSIALTQGLEERIEIREYEDAIKIRSMIAGVEAKMFVNEKEMFGGKIYKVTKKEVDSALEDYGVDVKGENEQDLTSLSNLEDRLSKRIIGQSEAVSLVSKALLRAKLGLRSKKRPLGNFLFLGPTGVGKTELAKALSLEFFGEDRLIRLDMSDFGEKHTVARLVGAPPGYVGYGEGGELTLKIEKNPSSLVLFDEIEKAHPDVLNILLQIMEEGELVDAKGTTYDFSFAVVILTSNLGTEIVHRPGIGFEAKIINEDSLEKRLRSNLKKILKPELLNRLDEVVVFKQLTKEDQHKILDLLLEEIRQNLLKQKITIRISEKVKQHLLDKGYSDEYGARALRRTVEREFLDKIAEVLLQNKKRPLKLVVSLKKGSIFVQKK